MTDPEKLPLIILTGLSGAGLSTALKVLEDQGYRAFDNFPLALIQQLLNEPSVIKHPIALAVDARSDDFRPEHVQQVLRDLAQKSDRDLKLVFLTADEAKLVGRFTETRRRHPLAIDRTIEDGIRKEQHLTYSLRMVSDIVIDTTELSVHDLRRILTGHFGDDHRARPVTITVQSFSYRRGLPREADLVIDVRFLRNPHWDPTCRPLTGRDVAVGVYIQDDPQYESFITGLQGWLQPLLPRYALEGKSYLTLAVGCTGGRHRSVFVAETLKKWLEDQGISPIIVHRDVDRSA
jgi:RNase adapter protein RapZ